MLDAAGNDVTDIRPTAPVHQGSWGPVEGKKGKDEFDQVSLPTAISRTKTLNPKPETPKHCAALWRQEGGHVWDSDGRADRVEQEEGER